LLFFEPETSTEHIARYYFRSEYLLLRNLPLQALEILARLDTPDLDPEQKRRVWYKIAIAQRMSHNYEGAAATIDRLIEHYPNREEFTRLKRRNLEQLMAEQSLD
jgi:outer membrane protein assembly factor BamD (BamD/ComL family)